MTRDERDKQRERWAQRRAAGREAAQQGRAAAGTQQRLLGPGEMSALKEVEYIIRRAQAGEGRVVTIRELLLFSTPGGDAWMLDTDDDFAMCLARDGHKQPYKIVETATQFAIDWPAAFSLEGDCFTVHERTGKTSTIMGYPLDEIRAAIARMRKTR